MSNRLILIVAALALSAPSLSAQKYIEAGAQTAVRARVSASIDKKVAKGLHVGLEEEARLLGDEGTLDKLYTTLSLDYKASSNIKFGGGYALISRNEAEGWALRHRGFLDVTESWKSGGWKFAFKEGIQATYRPGEMNLYQKPRTALAAKGRLKVSYKFADKPFEPYAGIEARVALNAVQYTEDLTHVDYDDVYINRVRLSLGTEWRLDKKNILDFYTLWDYRYNKDIDANQNGKLKKIVYQPGYFLTIGVAYKFAL